MKRILIVLALLCANLVQGQTAADKIAAGRAALVAHNLPAARALFQDALTLAPTNQVAAALLGYTRVFDVTSQASTQAMLDTLAVPASGRDVYNWTAKLPRDVNDDLIVPAAYNFTQVAAYWQSTLLPESAAARANLAVVTDASFLITLSPAETKMPVPLNIDYGDVLMARACLRAAEFLAHAGSGQNLDANLDAINQVANGDLLTVQRVLNDNPNFMTAGSASERTAAKTALLDMIQLYRQASIVIRARPAGLNRLFMLGAQDLVAEADFRQTLDKVELSLTEPVDINGKGLYAKPLFDPSWSARAQLPVLSATGFDVTTIPDASLGGVVSGFTKEKLAAALANKHDTIAEMGWEWVSPKPAGNTLYRYLALAGGKHLVVGNGGAYLTSTDGTNWTYGRIPGVGQFVDVAANGVGKIAGVTNDGTIYVSTDDGASWRRVYRNDHNIHTVVFAAGKYLAMGDAGLVVTSVDGESWTESFPNAFSMTKVLYTGGQYVAVGLDESTGNAAITTSPTGAVWTTRFNTAITGGFTISVAQGGGQFIAVCTNTATQQVTSPDGITWTVATGPGAVSSITYNNGMFVVAGNGGVIKTSPNGGTWTVANSGETLNFTGVYTGASATYVTAQSGVLLVATDATNATFTRANTLQAAPGLALNKPWLALKAIDGQLYAGGGSGATNGGVIARSADGQSFTTPTFPATGAVNDITDFLKQGSTYYAVGKTGTILTSADSGATWGQITSGTTNNLNTIAYLNGKFVVGANGSKILTSPDGASGNWTTTTLAVGGMQMNGVAFGNGVYVAVGGSNNPGAPFAYVLSSPDAAIWTQRNVPTAETLKGVVFFQGAFTAVGTGGTILRSTDGVTWTNVGTNTVRTNFTSISVLDGRYHATVAPTNLDGSIVSSQSAVAISSDGEDWVSVPLGTASPPNRVELFGTRLYTVNGNATILRSEVLTALATPVVQILTPSAAYTGTAQGHSLTLAVAVTSNGAVTYQWQKDGVDVSGATGSELTLDNIQPGAAGSYTVIVTNAAGTVVSFPFVVTVSATAVAPVITSQPESQTLNIGLPASLSVEATGSLPLTYQWKKDSVNLVDGGNVTGATTATLNFASLQATDGGTYTVVVTNAVGNTTSLAAILTVDSNPAYTFSTLAGSPGVFANTDGTGAAARFDKPYGAAVDAAGNVYVCSPQSHNIRKVTSAGVVTTIAGSTSYVSGNVNATGTAARFNQPYGVALNAAGTILYVADIGNSSVRKVDLATLAVTTLTNQAFSINALVVDATDNVYYTSFDHTVRKVVPAGTVTVFAGSFNSIGSANGTGAAARFYFPQAIALDAAGANLYVADSNNGVIRKITTAAAVVSTYAGQPGQHGNDDGPANSATFSYPLGVAVDALGNVFVADNGSDVIRKISPAQVVSTVGGQGYNRGFSNGVGAAARFSGPGGLAVDAAGNLYIPENYNQIIRKGVPLTSPSAPIIGLSPVGQVANVGSDVTLTVVATGTSALSYQWRKDGVNIGGATSATLVLTSVQAGAAGSYTVLVTSAQGSALSAPAVVTVAVAPTITVQPVAQTVTTGQPVTLSVTASDGGYLTYQWRRNGLEIAGAIYSTYTIAAAHRSDAAVYDVVINGVGGAVTSAPTLVQVAPTSYPGDIAFDPGFSSAPLLSIGSRIYAALALPGGKWLVGGDFVRWDSVSRPGLARLNADYSLDLTYTPPAINGFVIALAQAADGSIYVGGQFTAVDGNAVPGLFRLNSSHALDLSWRELDAPPYSPVCALAVQADGKVLVARASAVSNEVVTNGTNVLTRLNTDGTLDGSFSVNIASSGARLNSIIAESSGAIAFAGQFTAVNGSTRNGVARVDATGGVLDTTFGGTAGTNSGATVFSMTRLADGKYLLGGTFTTVAGTNRSRAAIIDNTTGALTAFNPVTINSNVLGAAQQTDGRIVLGGLFTTANGSATDSLVRLTATGTVDTLYPSAATVSGFTTSRPLYIFPQADGSTALFGSFQAMLNQRRVGLAVIAPGGTLAVSPAPLLYRPAFTSSVFALGTGQTAVFGSIDAAGASAAHHAVRFNDNGTLDATFPTGTGFGLNGLSTVGVTRAVVQADGKYLAVGDLGDFNGNPVSRLARINADGTFDGSFDAGGGPGSTTPLLLAVSGSRTLLYGVASGYTYNGQGVGAIARLNANGSRDGSLNLGSGFLNGANPGTVTTAYEQPDGKLVLAGTFTSYNGTAAAGLVRLNPNGAVDATFSAGTGVATVNVITGLPDGRLVLAGNFTTYNGAAANRMAIISATGTLDGTFTAPVELNAAVGQVLVQENGKFILEGDFTATPTPYFVRLTSAGVIDSTFALRGITGVFGSATRLLVGDDGSVYFYNASVSFNSGTALALARFRGAAAGPSVTTAPAPVTANAGSAATFFVRAGGTAPFTYQWRKNTVNIGGANYSVLNLANLVAGDAGSYDVIITNAFGNITSAAATLTVNVGPAFTTQPAGQTVAAGSSVTFVSAASGLPAPTYQWRKNTVNIGGATSASLTLNNVQAADAGTYTVVATNVVGSVTSNAAVLAVSAGTPPADFNADGKSDVVFQNTTTGERFVWLMNGTAYGSGVSLGVMPAAWQIAATADFNADGKVDLLWQNTSTGERVIWLMNGSAFSSAVSLGIVSTDWQIAAAADFNGDGKPDILWQNTATGERGVWGMNGTSVTGFVSLGIVGTDWQIAGAGDFNADGKSDIVWQNTSTGDRYIWLMNGTTLSGSVSIGTFATTLRIGMVGDYNGDGKPDLVWQNTLTGERTIWLMNGTTKSSEVSLGVVGLEWVIGLPGSQSTPALVAADFNADGKSDLLWQNTISGESYIWLMNGTTLSSSVFLGILPTQWQIAGTADLNADNKTDIIWQNTSTGERLAWLMNGTVFASSASLGTLPPAWQLAGTGDFNADGKPDLVWRNTTTGDCYIWLMNGTSFSSSVYFGTVGAPWQIAGVGDFNGDGKPDLVWENTTTGDHYLWLMNGTSFSSSVYLATLPPQWQVAGVGDFNGDGKADIIWQNSATGDRYVWLMNGSVLSSSVFVFSLSTQWQIRN